MSNIFLFYGEDNYSLEEKIEHWKKAFLIKFGAHNFEIIETKNLKIKQLITTMETLPFLAEKRLLIFKNFLKNQKAEIHKEMADFLPHLPDFDLVIFQETTTPDKRSSLYKEIKKLGKIEEFSLPSTHELTEKILKKAQKSGYLINATTARFLGEICGFSPRKSFYELDKLGIYSYNKGNPQEITKKTIQNLVTPEISGNIFKLTDAIGEKHTQLALAKLAELQAGGEEIIRIFHMIVRHFRFLIQVKELIQKKIPTPEIARKLHLHPFATQNMAKQSAKFDFKQLQKIYAHLFEIEIKSKSGEKNISLEIEKFIQTH